MDELISRRMAIDAIRASASKYTGFMEMEQYTDDDAVEAIEGVPSAQPDLQQTCNKHATDCISRRDAVSRFSDLLMLELKGKRLPTWEEVYNAMQDVPLAQPERKSGKWIPLYDDKGEHYGDKCSECGEWYVMLYGKTKFCPDCGCQMLKGEDNATLH